MIKVYSKAGCGYCDIAKRYLLDNNFEFEEIRVDLDETKRQWLFENGHRSVPQIFYKEALLVRGGAMELINTKPEFIRTKMDIIDANTSISI